jgi:hypothetical protein
MPDERPPGRLHWVPLVEQLQGPTKGVALRVIADVCESGDRRLC